MYATEVLVDESDSRGRNRQEKLVVIAIELAVEMRQLSRREVSRVIRFEFDPLRATQQPPCSKLEKFQTHYMQIKST